MSWKSVVKQCRFDCVGTGLFSVANMVFLLVFPVLSIVVSLVMISTHVDEHVVNGLMGLRHPRNLQGTVPCEG